MDAQRRDVIVAAAKELIDEDGLEALTIRAVLSRTGLARRAFYESFGGKDDLVLAVFAESLREAAVFYRAVADKLDNPFATIEHIVRGIVLGRYHVSHDPGEAVDRRAAALSREHLRLAEARPQDLHDALQPLLGLIAALVSEGVSTGQLRACDADLQARLIYNLVATTVHTELLAGGESMKGRKRREELAEKVWTFCRRAIVA